MNILFFLKPKSEVAFIYDDQTLRQALEIMEFHRYTAIPIINKLGKYIGTITEGDMLWGIKNEYNLSLDYLFGLIAKNEEYYPIELDLNLLAINLTNLRISHNYTQAFIASKLNTNQSAYCHYEKAKYIIPTSFIYGLTKIYKKKISIDKLFGRVKKNIK